MSEKVKADLKQLTPDQLRDLQAMVNAESDARGKWDKLDSMPGGEFDMFLSEQCHAGDRELREAAITRRLKGNDGS